MAGTPAAEISVSAELVRTLLADQHPQYAHLPVSFSSEGWDNFTFRLGDDLAVRLPRRELAVRLIRSEQRWLGELAPRLSLPVPASLAIGEPGQGFPWPWSIVPWIDGVPVDQAPLNADQGPALAAFLRALHVPSPPDAPVNPGRGVRLEVRRVSFAECLDRLRSSCDLITPSIERAWREALAAPICETSVWLHGDMHAQNILSEDGALAGVIDWGDMCGGDPAVDLCAVWGLLGDASSRRAALAAYGPDDALLARAKGWGVLFGAILFENGRLDNPRHAAIGEATLRRLAEDL
jgi:aminoglycoside phosphotransferase (APT) family kinase protein